MAEVIAGVLQSKGRPVTQFLQYYGTQLFSDKADLVARIIKILEEDKKNLKEPLTHAQAYERFMSEYCPDPELRMALELKQDKKRKGQPYRVTFKELVKHTANYEFRLYGSEFPIESLRENEVNFAITQGDIFAARFVQLLPPNSDLQDLSDILERVPYDTTTIEYAFPLKISESRHMLFMNYRPLRLMIDEKGLPLFEEGTPVAVSGEHYSVYDYLFNRKYKLLEGKSVESRVFGNGPNSIGIDIVASGSTLLAESLGQDFTVYEKPILQTSAIVLTNRAREEGRSRYGEIVDQIRVINSKIPVPEGTSAAYMRQNLSQHLIKGIQR